MKLITRSSSFRTPNSSNRKPVWRRADKAGFGIIALMIAVSVIVIGLLAALPSVYQQAKRDREEELIFRGNQYARAVYLFQKQFNRYPNSVKELLHTNNLSFLRRPWPDPMTPGGKWRFIHVSGAGVMIDSWTMGPQMGASPLGQNQNGQNGLNGQNGSNSASSVFGGSSSSSSSSGFGGSGFGGSGGSSGGFGGSSGSSGGFGGSGGGSGGFGGSSGGSGGFGGSSFGGSGGSGGSSGFGDSSSFGGGSAGSSSFGGSSGFGNNPGANGSTGGSSDSFSWPTDGSQSTGGTGSQGGTSSGGSIFGSTSSGQPAGQQSGAFPGRPVDEHGKPKKSPDCEGTGKPRDKSVPFSASAPGSSSSDSSSSFGSSSSSSFSSSSSSSPSSSSSSSGSSFAMSNGTQGLGLAGVASCSDVASLRTWNKKKHYSEWEFLGVGFNPGGVGAAPTPGNPQTGQGQTNGQTQGTGSIFGSSQGQNPAPGQGQNPLPGQGQGPGTNQNQNLGPGAPQVPDQPQNPPDQQQPPDQIQQPEQPIEQPPDQAPPDQSPPDQPPPENHNRPL